MLQIKCPKCEHVENVEDSCAGEAVTCSECGNVSMAPSVSATPPAVGTPAIPTPPCETQETVEMDKDTRTWGMFCHLAALAGFLPFILGLGWVIGPLIVWTTKKEGKPFIDQQGKNALNFQISMFIYSVAAVILMSVFVGFILLPILAVFNLVMIILAALKANDGASFRYPLAIRFLK